MIWLHPEKQEIGTVEPNGSRRAMLSIGEFRLAAETDAGPMYVHAGLEGSVISLSDTQGNITEKYRYTAFGLLTVLDEAGNEKPSSPALSPWLYHGRLYEESTGLYWMRMRHYSPTLGRFLQPDPAGVAGGPNLYAYASNNPLKYFDPWGLWPPPTAAGDPGNLGDPDGYGGPPVFGYCQEISIAEYLDWLHDQVVQFIATVGGENIDLFLETASPIAEASQQGALAFLDGGLNMIPGVDFTPFEDWGFYDSSELGLGWSQFIGSLTRDIAITISSFGFYSGAAGANATLGRTLFATEFAPTPLSLVISGDAALTPANLTLNYLIKTGGRISTGLSFARNISEGSRE